MTPERYRQVTDLYQAALDLPADKRAVYLEEACAGDEELRQEVESLFGFKTAAERFIETPALEGMATQLAGETAELATGKHLGKYRILALLGAGGMGEVYLAEDSQLHRRIALKALPAIYTFDKDRLRRFRTEARAAAGLNHPNIATVHTVEEIDGQPFITMEYVEGQTLNRRIPKTGFDLPTFFELFLPLTEALAHAHERGIIHRDIKPGNIIITREGVPKILDFGLARIHKNTAETGDPVLSVTQTGESPVMGTPAYMSPEQAQGEPGDQRSDIFSLGVCMYQSLTGSRPFAGANAAAIMSELLTAEPPSVIALKSETPLLLGRVIQRCLRKDPRHRYQTVREVRILLEEASREMSSNPIEPKSAAGTGRKAPNLYRLAAIALLLLLALLAGFFAWNLMRPTGGEAKAVYRFALRPPAGQDLELSWARLSTDGRYVVYAMGRGENRLLYLRALDQFESRAIPGTEGARNPFFSHDNQWIGFFLDGDKLRRISLTGGAPMTICDECRPGMRPYWAQDDTIIVDSLSGLYRVAASGGKPQVLTTIDKDNGEVAHNAPQLLPEGKRLLFTRQTAQGSRPAVLSLETGEWQALEDVGEALFAQYLATNHLVFARGNQLFAAPFDASRLQITEPPRPVLEGLYRFIRYSIADNGTLVYLPEASMKENSLVWVDRAGQATPLVEKRGDYRSPRLSADGRRVAVQVDNDIWVYDVEGGRGLRLTFEGENQTPLWTPDGKRVIFTSKRDNAWSLYVRAADGSSEAEKLLASEYPLAAYSLHPEEQAVALAVIYSTNRTDISLLSLRDGKDDRKATPFLTSVFPNDAPRFSPDGRWLAYFSTESDQPEIYVQSYPLADRKITVSRGGGISPVWSADGRELFYRQGNKFCVVDVKPGSQFTAGMPRTLFEGRFLTGFDVARDGKRFLMVKNEQGVLPTQLHVILNWTEELRRLAPTKY